MLSKFGLTILITAAFGLSAAMASHPQRRNELANSTTFESRSIQGRGVSDSGASWPLLVDTNNTNTQSTAKRNVHRSTFARRTEDRFISATSATIPLFREKGSTLYLGQIQIGTPHQYKDPQLFNVVFGTGSFDSWVGSSANKPERFYDDARSSTARDLQESFPMDYWSTTIKAQAYRDLINVRGVKAIGMEFGSVADPAHTHGVIGMAASTPRQFSHRHFLQAAMRTNPGVSPVFAFYLGSKSAELHLGMIKQSHHTGSIEFHQISNRDPGHWTLDDTKIFVGKERVLADVRILAAIDTGAETVAGPAAEVQKIYDKIHGSSPIDHGYYQFPCESAHDVGFSWPLPQGDGEQWMMSLTLHDDGKGMCLGAISSYKDSGEHKWMLGIPFLLKKYTIFKARERKVGFAKAADAV